MTSEDMSRAFYEQLGAAALAARTTAVWDQQIVTRVLHMLRPGQRVLDLGCGYGRIAVPVAVAGSQVVALDISPRLLAAAWQYAHEQGVTVMWLQASMCRIPLSPNTCDVALCLWSAFYELLAPDEQLAAVRDIVRVLRPGGWCLVEGALYEPATADALRTGKRYGPEGRIAANVIAGLSNPHYQHDTATLEGLMQEARISTYRVYVEPWGGRSRQFLQFEKSGAERNTTSYETAGEEASGS
jgi:ubiquinone/menaquinone biosynthesis C-methylase UbiE